MTDLEHQNYISMKDQLTFLIPGEAASLVPGSIKVVCADEFSQALVEHSSTMLQFKPEQLLESINKGWTVLALGEQFEPVGFVQLWQYGFNQDGQQILEFGSWLSFKKGLGKKLLSEGVYLGKKINPSAQQIAIVEESNVKAHGILAQSGAVEIGTKFQPAIKTVTGQAAFMKIFDITGVI